MDTILYNGIIRSMAGYTYSAIGIEDGRIALTGSDAAVLAQAGENCRCIDLKGALVLPGFCDSHMHMLLTEEGYHRLNLHGVKSAQEIIDRGRAFIKENNLKKGQWIIGYGYDHNVFDPPVLPGFEVTDAISTKYPVVLDRICGHVGAGNHLTFKMAGFTEDTVLPGGSLDKDEKGRLTGVVREYALDALKLAGPRIDKDKARFLLENGGKRMASAGITSVHSDDTCSEGTDWESLRQASRELAREGKNCLRLFHEFEIARDGLDLVLEQIQSADPRDPFLRAMCVKLIGDGSLGARTAAFREDYSDDPGNKGISVYDQKTLDGIVEHCQKEGVQIACHCIGDGSLELFLNAVERAQKLYPEQKVLHRVVHCQFGDETQYRRMGAMGMGADIQPAFVPSDVELLDSRLAQRKETGYAWKTLLDNEVVLGGGSDSPVESFAPLWGIHCAVNRPYSHENDSIWHAREVLTVEEAVALYTTGPARLAGVSDEVGTLEKGKLADMVVLDRDIFTLPKETIKDAQVLMTLLGGKITYDGDL